VVFVVMHTGPHPSILPDLLTHCGTLPAVFPQDGDLIEPGMIYVAPPDQHMVVEADRIRLIRGAKVHHTRPAADPLFKSVAESYGHAVLGVVLSGGDGDGGDGLRIIRECGGTAFVQDPSEAVKPGMPLHAIIVDHPDAVLPGEELARRVRAFCLVDPEGA
jgi:two-component system chemotaxis response regulator CheB